MCTGDYLMFFFFRTIATCTATIQRRSQAQDQDISTGKELQRKRYNQRS